MGRKGLGGGGGGGGGVGVGRGAEVLDLGERAQEPVLVVGVFLRQRLDQGRDLRLFGRLGCRVGVRRDRWAGVGIRHHIVPTGNSSSRISGLGRKKSSRNGDPQAPMILLTTLAV